MDEDIMLNIVTNKSNKQQRSPKNYQSQAEQNNQGNKKLSKNDIKNNKYKLKMKMRTNMSKSKNSQKGKQSQDKNTMFGSFVNKISQNLNENGGQYKVNSKRQSNIKRQDRQQRNKIKVQNQTNQYQYENKRSFKRPQNFQHKSISKQRNMQRRQRRPKNQNSDFKPELRKDVTVKQLMPELRQQQDHIDTNQLGSFKLQAKLLDSLVRSGVSKLTQIQAKSYQSLLNGTDCVIKASTGSGKTLAYLIPLINRIIKNKTITKRQDGTCIIVVCPTRQLCVQAQKQANRCLKRCPFIISGCLFGGEQTNHQKSRIRKGTNILFCTPGRVLYHLQQTKSFKLSNLQALVFEQADRTLDMGFQNSIHSILKILSDKIAMTHIHKILVSAHFNSKVSSLIQQLQMKQPQFIGFENSDSVMHLQKLKQSKDVEINTSAQLKHQYVLMSQEQKIPLMLAYLSVLKNSKILIFVSTIDQVQFFDYLLTNLKYRDSNGNDTQTRFENRPVYKIHGDLDQKLRSKTYLQFRQSKEAILISTQVASRGLDFPDLSHIILYDVPPTITDYGNRVGRSARFNQTGVSLLMLHYIQSDYAQKIRYYVPNLQLIQKDIIYQSFQKILKSQNIGDESLHYIEGLVRSSVKNDNEKYTVARKAYVSMLKSYARHPDRQIFAVKKLNLKLLARSFGLNNAQSDKNYNPKAKNSHLETSRKKRKVENIQKLQFSQYM